MGVWRRASARWRYGVVAGCYVAAMAAVTVASYVPPVTFSFHDSPLMWLACGLAVLVTVHWYRREPERTDWWLPVTLIALALISFPGTSADYLRYLFDGELIRVWHLSPYTHLPGSLPPDQYSRLFHQAFWMAMPSPYGPLSQAMMAAVNLATRNQLAGGVAALKLVNLAGLLVCARLMYLVTGRKGVSYLLMINPIVLMNTVATPHLDIVIVGGVLGAYLAARPAAKGWLLAPAGLIKAHALIFAPFVCERGRRWWATLAWTVLATGALLVALKPVVGFNWLAMLGANQDGGLFAKDSLLIYSLWPGASTPVEVLGSYALFALGYGAILVLFWRGRIGRLRALVLSSWLVPLCLTGLLLPWHFMIPLVFLLVSEGVVEYWAVLFLTLLVSRSAVTVEQLLVTAAVVAAGGWIIYQCYRRLGRTSKVLAVVVSPLRRSGF